MQQSELINLNIKTPAKNKRKKLAKNILHGPSAVGGIGGFLSKYQRSQGLCSHYITLADKGYKQNHDINFEFDKITGRLHRLIMALFWFLFALSKYRYFHFYFGMTWLPFSLDLPILRLFRKKIIMTYCGSEIRLIANEKKFNPFAGLIRFPPDHPRCDFQKKIKIKWQGLFCHKVFAIRSQAEHAKSMIQNSKVIDNIWLTNIGVSIIEEKLKLIDLQENEVPLIVHAPSETNIKGTVYVERAISALKSQGLEFEYIRVQGVSNLEAQKIYKRSDIIVDQFLIGNFGNLALEGMALGKPVVGYVAKYILEKYCPDCPIFITNINDIKKNLKILLLNQGLRLELGKKGVQFVEKYLDRKKINDEVVRVYNNLA